MRDATNEYTPGPWEFSLYGHTPEMLEKMRANGMEPVRMLNNAGGVAITAEIGPVAEVHCQTEYKRGNGHLTHCAERDANARLIAAAPELYETLEWLVSTYDINDVEERNLAIAQARAVLAKVENGGEK